MIRVTKKNSNSVGCNLHDEYSDVGNHLLNNGRDTCSDFKQSNYSPGQNFDNTYEQMNLMQSIKLDLPKMKNLNRLGSNRAVDKKNGFSDRRGSFGLE